MARPESIPFSSVTCSVTVGQRAFRVAIEAPIELAIPLAFNGPQPTLYGVPPAEGRAYQDGAFVGDTRRGGSCNFETYTLTPHCNGTHTEGAGHLTHARLSLHATPPPPLIPATLITLVPEEAVHSPDTYDPPIRATDLFLTRRALQEALQEADTEFLAALVIRTLPNDATRISRDYGVQTPPFFSLEAMAYLRSLNIQHLLVDLPSVDRLFDEGKLANHHCFWDLPPGSHSVQEDGPSPRTITEMIYVDNAVPDGPYVLNLQVPRLITDAVPSRPLLFRLHERP